MEVVTGALPSVITKLGELLVGEYKLQKRVRGEIRFLKAELESMQFALEKISNTPADQLGIEYKIWANELRELSYDIEDNIDTFMVRGDGDDEAKLRGIKKFIDRSVTLFGKVKVRRGIATEIRDIKRRVEEVPKRRCKLFNKDSDDSSLFRKATEPVGLDGARDEVINKLLTKGNEVSEQQGNIISIVGFGGLGKTTLANAVYDKLRPHFDCSAFISVSQTPDMNQLFKSMLYQLGRKSSATINDDGTLDIRQLIIDLNEFLQKKRYITVIDDIWDISVWKMIRCALPDNNSGYRIITTTRILDVAQQIGNPYKLQPLTNYNSRMLLYTKLFGNEDNGKSNEEQMAKVFDGILKQCAGVPLAIITIASSLASKEGNKIEWYNTYKSVGSGMQKSVDEDNMRMILSLSYYNLPCHLRVCLLYLSIFPEDYDIDKNRLIWLWIAEGLIPHEKQGNSLFDLGEKYLHELIDGGMIQLFHRPYSASIEYCRVHDMVLDLILTLSREDNFVTIWNDIHDISMFKKVRRLSLQNSKVDHAVPLVTIRMQQVRSVVVFPSAVNLLPALPSFRILRVLDLQDCYLSQDCSLYYLGNLLHLRYLGLRATGIALLPEEIGNLKFLLTLDVTCTEISSLPPSVIRLKNLMCLHIDASTRVPNGIGSLSSLEELSTLCINDSTDIIEELGHLTELRVLGIECRTSWNTRSFEKSLVECLHKLQKIQSLCIWVSDVCNLDTWVTPQHLRRLELTGCWSRMPSSSWILFLHLSFLSIEVRILKQKDVEILGMLPALQYLSLEVYHQSLRILGGFIAGPCTFPCLVQCELLGFIGPVLFQQGAMPRLATLRFMFPVRVTREHANSSSCGLDSGLGNLPSLRDVTVIFRPGGAGGGEVEEAKAAVTNTIENHPNNPALKTFIVQD